MLVLVLVLVLGASDPDRCTRRGLISTPEYEHEHEYEHEIGRTGSGPSGYRSPGLINRNSVLRFLALPDWLRLSAMGRSIP